MGGLNVRQWPGLTPYDVSLNAMQQFTRSPADTPAELWLLEHPSLYTQGIAGKPEHLLLEPQIPVIQSDRGGQITWHGPGQLVGYLMINLFARSWHVRDLVSFTEQTLLAYLKNMEIDASVNPAAPGVYIEGKKIASLGFRIHNHWSYHGFSLNVCADLLPFSQINPCGFAGMQMLNLNELRPACDFDTVRQQTGEIFREKYQTFN